MRRLEIAFVVGTALLSVGCQAGPTLDDARDYLDEGDPESALEAARGAAGRTAPRRERLALRRVAFRASLTAGWCHEAASEYLELRRLTGHEDPQLLTELGRSTVGLALRGPDGGRRLLAVTTLRDLGDLERARARTMAALSDQRPDVRAAATDGVAALESLDDALSGLERATADRSSHVRGAALSAARLTLLPRYAAHEREAVRQRLTALAVAGASDASAQVRLAGVDLLSVLGDDPVALEALSHAVGNGSDSVSLRAAQRLLSLDPALAFRAWTRAQPGGKNLAAFGRSLALHVGKGSASATVRDLRSSSYRQRLAAVQGLVGPAALQLAAQLRLVLRRDAATTIRVAALQALIAAGGETAASAIALAAQQDDPATRRAAFIAASSRSALSREALAGAFDDPATSLDAARELLEQHGAEGAAIVRAGLGNVARRAVAAEALGERGDPSLREVYLALLDDPDPRMRRQGARGLIGAGLPEDRILLVQAMLDPDLDTDLVAGAALVAIMARMRDDARNRPSVQ